MDLPFLPSGLKIGRELLHDWTQSLVITRERDDDGAEVCICWVGTFSLITTDSAGWFPDEGRTRCQAGRHDGDRRLLAGTARRPR